MLPFSVLALLITLSLPAAAATIQTWDVQPEESSLTFAGTQMGSDFKGTFKNFDATIQFDEKQLDKSSVDVSVTLSSLDSEDDERDTNLKGVEFFNIEKFPTARFAAQSFKKTETGYIAEGTLTIGEISAPLSLPFTLSVSKSDSGKEIAVMDGETTLDRSIWKIGVGDWTDSSIIANAVTVTVHLIAHAH